MKRLITSCFGLGRLPVAPGTWGSLPPAVIFGILCLLPIPLWVIALLMVAFTILASVLCVTLAPAAIAATGRKDPGEVVMDEVAGQSLTYVVCALFATHQFSFYQALATAIAGFLLFRIFDIIKPWPAYKLESLPAGWGILCDDLAAGIYAAIGLGIALKLWILA